MTSIHNISTLFHVKKRRKDLFDLDFLEMRYYRPINVVRNWNVTKYALNKLGLKDLILFQCVDS